MQMASIKALPQNLEVFDLEQGLYLPPLTRTPTPTHLLTQTLTWGVTGADGGDVSVKGMPVYLCNLGFSALTTGAARVGAWDIQNSLDPMFHHNV